MNIVFNVQKGSSISFYALFQVIESETDKIKTSGFTRLHPSIMIIT